MIITIIMLLIGIMILGGGLYYLLKEKGDEEARRIYLITVLAGAVLTIGVIVKIVLAGF